MRKIIVFLMTITASFSLVSLVTEAKVEAAGVIKEGVSSECAGGFLGFAPWYKGVVTKIDGKCEIGTPTDGNNIAPFVITIVLNVLTDLTLAIGYITLGFIIYGGYLYIMAGGDPGKVAKGKKTIEAAVIGTAIALLANVIINLIVGALTNS